MPTTMTAAEAKAHLADCLRSVERGEPIVITRYGKPVAALIGVEDLARLQQMRIGPHVHLPPGAPFDNGLGELAGTWTDDEAAEFDAAVAPLDEIDEELWR
jgi:prevent-host-death family protein